MTMRAERNGARVVADALRAREPVLDELTRARLEKRFVDAAAGGTERLAPRRGRAGRRLAVGASVVVLAAAAVWLVVGRGGFGDEGDPARRAAVPVGVEPGTATFEAMGGEQPVHRGVFSEGEAIETRAGQRVLVRFAQSRIDVTPETRARFARLRAGDVRVALDVGRVDVVFHPRRRGAEHLTIETPSARVEVVGTEFTVELDAARATTVRVSEGVVRVVPLDGTVPRLVYAGRRTRVLVSVARPSMNGAVAVVDVPIAPELTPSVVDVPTVPGFAPASVVARRPAAITAPPEAPQSGAPVEVVTAESRFIAASRLYHRGRLEEAAEALLPLAHDGRSNATVRRDASNLLGDIYKGWRRLEDALVEYDRACGLGNDESCYSLGGIAETLEQNDRARVAYRTYLRRAPDGAFALQARAHLCRPLGISEACYGSVVTPYTP